MSRMFSVWILVLWISSWGRWGATAEIDCNGSTKPYTQNGSAEGLLLDELRFFPGFEVLRFGKPTAFVSTKSVGINPYSVIDPFRQSYVYHEYILIGPGIAHNKRPANVTVTEDDKDIELDREAVDETDEEEEIQLVIYDQRSFHEWNSQEELFQQNLAKRYMWKLINGTGMLPSMTIKNSTYEKLLPFHTDDNDYVAYHIEYRRTRSQATRAPLDVVIEFPAKTRMFETHKTLIDYQSVGLLRWRLSPQEPYTWNNISDVVEPLTFTEEPENYVMPGSGCRYPQHSVETMFDPKYLQCIYLKRFKSAVIPCIKDMIVLYKIFGSKPSPAMEPMEYFMPNRLFLRVPMVDQLLAYQGWLDLTPTYCPFPEEPEECGDPLDLVLTNDHILILTTKGLFVSSSLNSSTVNASYPYALKPMIKFTPVDPCQEFEYVNCSHAYTPVLIQQTVIRQRLFYTPVCHLFQYPNYEDMVIFVIEHVTVSDDYLHERDALTILYAAKPYDDWKMLIYKKMDFTDNQGRVVPIKSLLGIFYNHHKHHFDITIEVEQYDDEIQIQYSAVRFVLPLPEDPELGHQETHLSGHLAGGLIEFYFPLSMKMTSMFVSTETFDLFFTGNQVWIAEAASQFVYLSIPDVQSDRKFNNTSEISDCSFNHPDRTFVCVEKTHATVYVGRIGVKYSATSFVVSDLSEMRMLLVHNMWTLSYQRYILMLGHFVAGYSGKIMLWYLDLPQDLTHTQLTYTKFIEGACPNGSSSTEPAPDCIPALATDDCLTYNTIGIIGNDTSFPHMCLMCSKLMTLVQKYKCKIVVRPHIEPKFKLLSIEPSKIEGMMNKLDGPLVPFVLDGIRVLFFEATIPPLPGYEPRYDYLDKVDVGSKLACVLHEVVPEWRKLLYHSENQMEAYDVQCPPFTQKQNAFSCNGYIRHLKSLETNGKQELLPGFRSVLMGVIVDKAFPMTPIPTDFTVLVLPGSNKIVVQLDTKMFEDDYRYEFSYYDVGKTLYLPSHFSALLQGFPVYDDKRSAHLLTRHNFTRMVGVANRIYRMGARLKIKAFSAYLIDFSTQPYCEWYKKTLINVEVKGYPPSDDKLDVIAKEYRQRLNDTNDERMGKWRELNEIKEKLVKQWAKGFADEAAVGSLGPLGMGFEPVSEPKPYHELEEELLDFGEPSVGKMDENAKFKLTDTKITRVNLKNFVNDEKQKYCGQHANWALHPGGCHLRLSLTKNPVIFQSGGRISLDKYDTISFQIKLSAITQIGKTLIRRPLISITNTNPDVLLVDQDQKLRHVQQIVNITISPTGKEAGVAILTIRPVIVSNQCHFPEGSFTLIVQVRRAPGRRLHVNYPIAVCKAILPEYGVVRRWKIDLPNCIPRRELLEMARSHCKNDKTGNTKFFSCIPENYRPPSAKGTAIPLSGNVYHADTVDEGKRNEYRISKATKIRKCSDKVCVCSDFMKLSDDELYTECKNLVYTIKRGKEVEISMDYDRIMRDEDQYKDYIVKNYWSVFIVEVNERTDFRIDTKGNKYLEAVNRDEKLNRGRQMYDMKSIRLTCHGTGLFHFKVSLGHFESFGEVTGYFMVYVDEMDSLNHIFIVVLMLATICLCMAFVFCGFLLVRKRLSSQLPFRPKHAEKAKLE